MVLIVILCSERSISQIMDIGSKREIFIDHYLIDSLINLELRLNTPQLVTSDNIPNGYYQTIIKTDSLYRIYYRDRLDDLWTDQKYDGNQGEITKSATSTDGYNWQEEATNLNDTIKDCIFYEPPFNHNFTPFVDLNPGSKHKFKALAGIKAIGGLYYFYSDDGIEFHKYSDEPIISVDTNYYEFDSQNIAFWSIYENQYVCYFRRFIDGLRSFSRTTSKDFIDWSEPINIFPNQEGEHLYTSGTQPYFRAPHIYISLATRFFPDRGNSTDIVIMNSRDGIAFNRTFKEAFIRPGLNKEKWGNRSNYITLNVVPLDESYIGIYARNSLYRIRMDGFSSVKSDYKEGVLVTKPIKFNGDKLEINYSTSAGGYMFVQILDENNNLIKGISNSISDKLVGDEISGIVTWNGSQELPSTKGKPIRLRISMKEADLYSIKFIENNI